jgi:predicted phosphohydrolase
MRIQYFSDVHLEFLKPYHYKKYKNEIRKNAPVLLLAGDIGSPHDSSYDDFLKYLAGLFEKIFIIHGNHEYYGSSLTSTEEKTISLCNTYSNVTYLQNSYEDYNGYRFTGTTLWSHISNDTFLTNDFRYISDFTIDTHNRLHNESKQFLRQTIQTSPLPLVVMTHHLPSHTLVDPSYTKYKDFQQCFSSDTDDLITFPVHSWIYGHTHKPFRGTLNGVYLYCNPIGYIGENSHISFNKVFEIP